MIAESPIREIPRARGFENAYGKDFLILREFIRERYGLCFPPNKYATLQAKLLKVCRGGGAKNFSDLRQKLMNDPSPALKRMLAEAITTNFTHFFREEKTFRFLQNRVFATLPAKTLPRIWSAASSSGEEAYTLAIILAESFFHGDLPREPVIIGSDISEQVLQRAETGIYPREAVEKVPPAFLEKYFVPRGDDLYEICPAIKKLVIFRRINLMASELPFRDKFHVIFCRNIFYYFDKEKQEYLARRLYENTLPGAWLFTSVTESLRGLDVDWTPLETGIFRKLGVE